MPKNSKQPISKNKRIDRLVLFIVIPCIFLVIALCILALSIKDKNDVLIQKERMSAYLENKYGEKFIVTDAAYEGSGLAVDGSWRGHARPESDSSLSFQVDEYKDGYEDQYIGELLSLHEKTRINELLKNLYQDIPTYDVNIYLSKDAAQNATIKDPLDNLVNTYGALVAYSLDIRATTNKPLSFNQHVDNINKVTRALHDRGIYNIGLRYSFIDNGISTYKCTLEPKEEPLTVEAFRKSCSKE